MHRALLSLILLGAALPASAQIGVYGTFSAANFRLANTGWQYGSTFGLYDNRWKVPFFALGVDGRGSVIGGTQAQYCERPGGSKACIQTACSADHALC